MAFCFKEFGYEKSNHGLVVLASTRQFVMKHGKLVSNDGRNGQ
jgi:hypothetical protein